MISERTVFAQDSNYVEDFAVILLGILLCAHSTIWGGGGGVFNLKNSSFGSWQQKVVSNGFYYLWTDVLCGVSKGSLLDPGTGVAP